MTDTAEIKAKVAKIEEIQQSMAVTQAEQLIVLKNVVDQMTTEKENSKRIAVLENNWKWIKWVLSGMIIPLIFLILRQFL